MKNYLKESRKRWIKTGLKFFIVNAILWPVIFTTEIHWLKMVCMWLSIGFNMWTFGYCMANTADLIKNFYNDED